MSYSVLDLGVNVLNLDGVQACSACTATVCDEPTPPCFPPSFRGGAGDQPQVIPNLDEVRADLSSMNII